MRQLSRIGLGMLALVVLTTPARAGEVEKLLPDDTEMVLSFNMEQAVNSAVFKKYALSLIQNAMQTNSEVQKVLQATGLDPLKDIQRITLAGALDFGQQDFDGVVIVNGKFDKAKLEQAAKASNAVKSMDIDGMTYFEMQENDETTYATVVDSSTIVLANSKDGLGNVIAKAKGTMQAKLMPALQQVWGRVKPSQTLVMSMVTKDKFNNIPLPNPQAGQALDKIDAMTVSLNVTDQLELEIGIGLGDQNEAQQMGAMVQQGLPQMKQFAQLMTIQQPDLKEPITEVVDSLRSQVDGKFILIKAAVSEKALDTLVTFAKNNASD